VLAYQRVEDNAFHLENKGGLAGKPSLGSEGDAVVAGVPPA